MYKLHQQGFNFAKKVGMMLFEVHAFHPGEDGLLVMCGTINCVKALLTLRHFCVADELLLWRERHGLALPDAVWPGFQASC